MSPITESSQDQIVIQNHLHSNGIEFSIQEILQRLNSPKKSISSMYFYDALGSKLFEEITELPEYYPTRTEKPLIKEAAQQFESWKDLDIIELGSGDSSKISLLFDSIPEDVLSTVRYIPIDVSHSAIAESADILADRFPQMSIHGLVADFMTQLDLLPKGGKRLFCFFGSTIGNFNKEQAQIFIERVASAMNPGDRLLLGIDRVKEKDVLESAYNDAQGVTAKFNLNILDVVNDIADTDFDTDAFEHFAFYNEEDCRIEMHLRAIKEVSVSSPHLDSSISILAGETIHTENSCKFSDNGISRLQEASGLELERNFIDKKGWFSLVQFYKNGDDINA